MAQALRVLVFNADEAYASELRRALLRVPGLKIAAEVDEPGLLPQALSRFQVDLLFIHLDPQPDFVLEIMQQTLADNRELQAVALSGDSNGDVVLRAMRAGFREFLVKPLAHEELVRVVGKIEPRNKSAKDPGKLVAVIGSAGGVGATTIATNLAVELSALCGQPGRVALVDLDFRFGHVATMLDLHPVFTIADLCDNPEQVDPAMINKALINHESGVRVLARPSAFAQADAITAAHCASVLTALTGLFDFVVVDGPSRNDAGGLSVIDSADFNLLVLQLLVPSVRNTDRICRELSQEGFNLKRIQLVCNRLDSECGYLDLPQVQKTLGQPIFASIPDDWRAVGASINIGQPLSAQWGKSKTRLAIAGLARKVFDPQGAAEQEAAGRGGIFSKLLGGSRSRPAAEADAGSAAAAHT